MTKKDGKEGKKYRDGNGSIQILQIKELSLKNQELLSLT